MLARILGTFALAAFVATGLSVPTPVSAGESSALIEEIVVTARKRQERLQDIPTSSAALTSDFIEDVGGVFHLRDITDLIAGISINETQEPTLSEPTLRGAGQSRNRASVSATGLYRNGAYFATNSLGGKSFARLDTYDLERVEVLRGPQGALYGRNALGGSMNLISKKPTDQLEVDFNLAAGELDMRRFDGRINIPLGEQFAFRASHFDEKRDKGFYTDLNGDYIDDNEYRHTRASLRFQPNDDWDINYVFDIQEEETMPAVRVWEAQIPDIEDAFETSINSLYRNFIDVENHNLVLDWTLGQGTLTSVSNYRERELAVYSDNDYLGGLTRQREVVQTVDNDIFFQEIRYVADATDTFHWLVGADYFTHDNVENINAWIGPEVAPGNQLREVNMDADSWAVFGMAEYTFDGVPITLTGEIRYAEDKVDGDVTTYRARNQPNRQDPDPDNPVNPVTDFASKDKFTNLPWGVTAAYRFDQQDMMAYFKIASSYRHGGLNLNEGTPGLELFPVVLTYGEETSLTYELGFKSTWLDRALTLNGAVYFSEYKDFLNTTTNGCPGQCQLVDGDGNGWGYNPDGSRVEVDGDGNLLVDENDVPIPPNDDIDTAFFIDNVGKAEAWGFEIEGTYRAQFDFGGTLLFNLGYARGKGEVKSLNDDVSEATRATAEDAKLPYLRPNQVKGSVVYRQTLGGLSNMTLFRGAALVGTATYAYESGGKGNLTNTDPWEQDTVKRLNAHLGFETDVWSLFIRGNNLTDESYRTHHRNTWYIRNTPRYIYGELMVRIRP